MSGRMGEWSLKLPHDSKPIRLQPSMIFIGRSECDIVINSTTVDKRHAVIYFNQHDQQFHIKDLNTLSGTYVNGTRIPEQSYVKLEHGDQVRFGYHKQAFEMQLARGSEEDPARTSFNCQASAATPLEDEDSLNGSPVIGGNTVPLHVQQQSPQQRQTSLTKGSDSLEDVSLTSRPSARGELQKNHSVPALESPTSEPGAPSGYLRRAHVPRDLPLGGMVASYHAAPVRSPSEPQIDNRMVASSLWDQEAKRSPTRSDRAAGFAVVGNGGRRLTMTMSGDHDGPISPSHKRLNNNNNISSYNNNIGTQSNGANRTHTGQPGVSQANNGTPTTPKKSPLTEQPPVQPAPKEKAKAFVINFDEPKRRASIPQSVLQRREFSNRSKEEDCRGSEFSSDSTGTGGTVRNGLNGSLSDSANFLIQKMLQSNNEGTNVDGDDEELADQGEEDGDHQSEAGTYTVDDPQAKEARRKIDQVFGVHGTSAHSEDTHAFNDYQNRTRTFSKATKSANVPVTRTQPVVAPPRRNRTTSSSTFLASSVPTSSNVMTDSMVSSTISSGSSTGGLPSKPAVVRSKTSGAVKASSATSSAKSPRRPSSSGVTRPPSARSIQSTGHGQREPSARTTAPKNATAPLASTLRRGTYGGSDFSLESSNSSGSHLTAGDSMKMNRAFALRRARLGLQEPVVSQKAHLLTGSNPNLFSRQDGGRFSMRLPSAKQRTRPGTDLGHQPMSGSVSGPSASGLTDTNRCSPRTNRRNESDPCSINLLGQESDEVRDVPVARPESRSPRGVDPLSQSTFEPTTQGRDALCDAIAEMCRSASFNAHPDARDRGDRAGAGGPLLQRKETFLKQHTSPRHQPMVDRAPTNTARAACAARTASPSRGTFSPQLQRRALGSPLSPQISRKVLPSPQASPGRQKPPTGSGPPGQPAGQEKERNQPVLSALDTLVVQAISQLSGKIRFTARALVERESQRYPKGSDALLTIQELLASMSTASSNPNAGDISKELSSILRNLRNVEQSLNVLSALEPGPPIPADDEPEPEIEAEPAKELPDAESLGDTVPRGFFTVTF